MSGTRDSRARGQRAGTCICLIVLTCVLNSGCAAVALTGLGVDAAVGVKHTLNGIAYRTFAEPLPKVQRATLVALKQMAFPVEKVEKARPISTALRCGDCATRRVPTRV